MAVPAIEESTDRTNPRLVSDSREEGKSTKSVDQSSASDASTDASKGDWWDEAVKQSVLDVPRWVTFDLETVLLDTLESSSRIKSVSRKTSVKLEAIVQQDAAFDPTVLFDSRVGRTE